MCYGGVTGTHGIECADKGVAGWGNAAAVGNVVVPSEHADDASAGQLTVQVKVIRCVFCALRGGKKSPVRRHAHLLHPEYASHQIISAGVEQVSR